LNGVFEPGESVVVEPAWHNALTIAQTFTGTASTLTGPPGPVYTLEDILADYGSVSAGATTDCYNSTPAHDCYAVSVMGARPAAHWDATFDEALSSGLAEFAKTWTLHVGGSFTDVSTDIAVDPYYPSIETIFHNQVSVGCQDGTVFCPTDPTTRQEMAVFLLKASQGANYYPPACAGIFSDVPCTPGVGFSDWIEDISNRGITAGCQAPGDPLMYCPTRDVLRSEMAVFLLKTSLGSAYDPPDCAGIFSDVQCTPGVGFSDWIEDISSRGITAGCQAPGDPLMYCPDNNILRQEMAVFLVKTFGLQLYGP
jgi:Pyruvate/2-oxoacid:ferredoxin oxidoreductase delta subunit